MQKKVLSTAAYCDLMKYLVCVKHAQFIKSCGFYNLNIQIQWKQESVNLLYDDLQLNYFVFP